MKSIRVLCQRIRFGYLLGAFAVCFCGSAAANKEAEVVLLDVELTLPSMSVAEYHRPYVAVWVENAQRKNIANLALWLEQPKWHRDLRSWWRRGGSQVTLPVDGVSGATRKPGKYQIDGAVAMPPGRYTVNVEAVREVGGRELIRFPVQWSGEALALQKHGKSELGAVRVRLKHEE